MRRDGRFEPLTVLAQAAALVAVLWTWWRHDRKHPAPRPSRAFYVPTVIETPWRTP